MKPDLDNIKYCIKSAFEEGLLLNGGTRNWVNQINLYNIPELDCISVMNVIILIEKKLGVFIEYDCFNTEIFNTLEKLANYIQKNFDLLQNFQHININNKVFS